MKDLNKSQTHLASYSINQTQERDHRIVIPNLEQLRRSLNWPIILITMALICFGLLMVFSSSMYLAEGTAGPNPVDALMKQAISVVIGLVLGAILFLIPIDIIRNPNIILLGQLVIIMLLIYTIFKGESAYGAKSWIFLGSFSFQPSELAKISSIIALSWLLDHFSREVILAYEDYQKNIKSLLIFSSIIIIGGIILLQPDLGMLFILFFSLGIFWAIYGASNKINILVYIGILILFIGIYLFSSKYSERLITTNVHFLERLGIYIDPFIDESNVGYQLVNGYVAFSRGGFWGVGLGNGSLKQGVLPAIQNDFIIANIAEELGMLGVIGLLTAYFLLFAEIFRQSALAVTPFRSRIIGGMGIVLFVQTMINLGGVLGLIPLTGVTLPFISSGGSSMIISILSMAFVVKMIYEENEIAFQRRLGG